MRNFAVSVETTTNHQMLWLDTNPSCPEIKWAAASSAPPPFFLLHSAEQLYRYSCHSDDSYIILWS